MSNFTVIQVWLLSAMSYFEVQSNIDYLNIDYQNIQLSGMPVGAKVFFKFKRIVFSLSRSLFETHI